MALIARGLNLIPTTVPRGQRFYVYLQVRKLRLGPKSPPVHVGEESRGGPRDPSLPQERQRPVNERGALSPRANRTPGVCFPRPRRTASHT